MTDLNHLEPAKPHGGHGRSTPTQARIRKLEQLKLSCFSTGIRLTEPAVSAITRDGKVPLTVHEYATTGGVTLLLEGDVYINAPFDDWFDRRGEATLTLTSEGTFEIRFRDETFSVEQVLPLPGYLNAVDRSGFPVCEVAMSHADRVRLSPIRGCAYNCDFCDLPSERYKRYDADRLVDALEVALLDTELPVSHGLLSGGSPGRAHYDFFEQACKAVARASTVPFDIMMSPRVEDPDFVVRMIDSGIHGFALNVELYDEVVGGREPAILRRKAPVSRQWLEQTIVRAVGATGGNGRVRSLLIVGLESPESTLRGVQWLAERGCDPVLSPFRPARNTQLAEHEAAGETLLADVLEAAREIVRRFDVQLGPRCVPCQHNTLSFPWDVEDERVMRPNAP